MRALGSPDTRIAEVVKELVPKDRAVLKEDSLMTKLRAAFDPSLLHDRDYASLTSSKPD